MYCGGELYWDEDDLGDCGEFEGVVGSVILTVAGHG
jgi:hypothetical protein